MTIDQHYLGEMSSSVYQRVPPSEEEIDWNYYEEDAVTRKKTWKTRKFASFDRAGWDQAKQSISKGGDIIIRYKEERACAVQLSFLVLTHLFGAGNKVIRAAWWSLSVASVMRQESVSYLRSIID